MPRKKTIRCVEQSCGATRTDVAFCGRASRLRGLRALLWYENTNGCPPDRVMPASTLSGRYETLFRALGIWWA
jgi:hypothetical protein